MNTEQQRSILTIALFAAFADGVKDERERNSIRDIAAALSEGNGALDITKLYQDVLLKRITLEAAVAPLAEMAHRQLAYEMAVCVCDADGSQSEAEKRFLEKLQALLGLNQEQAEAVSRDANLIAAISDEPLTPIVAASASQAVTLEPFAASKPQSAPDVQREVKFNTIPTVNEAEIDQSILKYSILNGALEILPQSWASLAIIPLQIKMVYRIGKAHGVELDKGHIKEFIAAAGVGLTSQYMEQFGRKLLGGLLGKAGGKMLGSLGSTATGAAFSFASTYALGHVAKRYYAGGRQMSTAVLKETFQSLLGPAKQLQSQHLAQIQQTAGGLDAAQVMALVRQ